MHPKVRELDSLLRGLERPGDGRTWPRISTGCAPLDAALPGQGLLRGSLVEWLGCGPGCGAGVLALRAAREACREGGAVVVIDPGNHFYPPAAVAGGLDLQRTLVVRPARPKQHHWALDQALRCRHVAAVIAWPQQLDSRTFRRWQLAVESSGCLGLLLRPAAVRREASWADVRLLISPAGPGQADDQRRALSPAAAHRWRLKIELLRCRGGSPRRVIDVEIDEQTGDIHAAHPGNLVTQLADSAIDPRQARA